MSVCVHWSRRRRVRVCALGFLSVVAVAASLAARPASALASTGEARTLDPGERAVVAALNHDRQGIPGLGGETAPLAISSALTQAASDYAEYLRTTAQFGHHAGGATAAERARAAGWRSLPGPGLSVAENLYDGPTAAAAYEAWKTSPSHAAVLFHPGAYWVGLGRSANKWVLLVGGHCTQTECEPTAPFAVASAPPRPARLRFRLRRLGRRVVVGVRVVRGDGRVLVRVRRSDGLSARRTGVSREGSLWRYRFRLRGPGRWRAAIRLRPDPGWTGLVVRSHFFTVLE